MKWLLFFFLFPVGLKAVAQSGDGLLEGNLLDEKGKALPGATVELISLIDSPFRRSTLSSPEGFFRFNSIPFGRYQVRFSFVGRKSLVIDSIYFRAERHDFNLGDVVLTSDSSATHMDEVIIYLEKPLIQSKDGNITFNAGESPLSAGSSASELLTNVPLVTKDPSGQLLVKGKEPKILIDDKPVELNLQQLQDLLEAMPGSSIEKIEVMTNPPPQYASEQGGVINIVTRKGTVGLTGRISVYAGSRGEAGVNGGFSYRKRGLSLNINTGAGYNDFETFGLSRRINHYKDSSNFFNTDNQSHNTNLRPNFRASLNYDLNKFNAVNLVIQYNQNRYDNTSINTYSSLDRNGTLYRFSERNIRSKGHNYSPNVNLSYTFKTKKPGESLRFIGDLNGSSSTSHRDFYQSFILPSEYDSTQQQINDNQTKGSSLRLNYELPLKQKRTYLSLGSYHNRSDADIISDASYLSSASKQWEGLEALTNHFRFRQYVTNFRASLKKITAHQLSATAGLSFEQTRIRFDLYKTFSDTGNRYWSLLPFASVNKTWNENYNLSFSYRRTIRRPGINELNPTVDFGDPYNIRFGNPGLTASLAHNFDLVLGRTKSSFYANFGVGYNLVEDIFAQVRSLLPDGKTQITWENISGRKEYEASTWSGYTINKQMRVNLSASYRYNRYSAFDKAVRKYRDGGSFTSNANINYVLKSLYTATGSFTFNRFANPQGTVRSSLSMNLGLQAKMLKKKMTATLNIIDPFFQQENRVFTYGTNFELESYTSTRTRNFRLTIAYNLSKKAKKPVALPGSLRSKPLTR